MSDRGKQLHTTADEQIAELIGVIAALDDTTLRLPCPGREKLGDGTIAAYAHHTADNYERIANFVETSDRTTVGREPNGRGGHRVPWFLKGLGHRPPDHTEHRHDAGGPPGQEYSADGIDLNALREQLAATREALKRIATLTESQLQAIPPDGSFRFCDGQRTLDQVLASLLKHQDHQVKAVATALA